MENARSVKVEIVTIGDEILIGQIVDTNSAWMAVQLNNNGFEVVQITSVHDEASHITSTLDLALLRADIVLFTGGIGPTNDDITKQTLCKYFGAELVFDHSVYQNIEKLFENRPNLTMNELTKAQAMVPQNCTVIQNECGTAPITWFDYNSKVVVSMPGVPYEMMQVMSGEIIPRLKKQFKTPAIIHKTFQVVGYTESALAIKIANWESSLNDYLHLAYLPGAGVIKLRLSGYLDNSLALEFVMNQQMDLLRQLLGDSIVATEDVTFEKLLANLLLSSNKTVATAESCTGGNIARLFTSIAGSSDFFKGSVVAYSNDVKIDVLKVKSDVINEFGAVSQLVAEQMALGVRDLLKTDYAIATTGIAGPDGGTELKPVGTVWISVCSADMVLSKEFRFGKLREQNIIRSSQAALLLLKEIM